MKTLEEAIEVAKKQVLAEDCIHVVIENENGFELLPVKEEVDIGANFRALVSDSEITFFTHTDEGIIAEVTRYGQAAKQQN